MTNEETRSQIQENLNKIGDGWQITLVYAPKDCEARINFHGSFGIQVHSTTFFVAGRHVPITTELVECILDAQQWIINNN